MSSLSLKTLDDQRSVPGIPRRVICYALIYLVAVSFVVVVFLNQSVPVYGFRWMPRFGSHFEPQRSKEFRTKAGYVVSSKFGYDGQFYAQLATDPLIRNPETLTAFDNFGYRARRPLFAMTAYVAGGGEPKAVLQAYSVQNIVFWLILAGVLLYWLPPTSWQNTYRYLAILYSIGLVGSVHQALLDGPALTLIAIGVLMADLRKPWISAMVLGLAGLGKETSILAASLFGFPKIFDPKQVFLYALKLGIVVLPLALWMYYVARIGHSQVSNSLGSAQNFDWPLFGWWAGVQSLLKAIDAGQSQNYSVTTAIFLIALPVQVFAVLAMRQTSNHWWRVGAVFAVFSIFIGIATWEGLVGSAARLCMPVTVAFNILAPRTGKWFVVLILGNMLSLLGFQELIHARPPKSVRIQSLSHELPGSSYFYSNTLAFEVPGDKRPLSFMLMNPTLRTK